MNQLNQFFAAFKLISLSPRWRSVAPAFIAMAVLLFSALPAVAHHASGRETPSNALAGFLSGLGHPIIGLDHLTFVIAAGLLAALLNRGFVLPIAFVVASLIGTGIHLLSLNLPAPEFFISASVLLFGILLALKNQPNPVVAVGLAAVAGLFHGYAYGESIVGAEMTPLIAYLLGFASIQVVIALLAYWIGRSRLTQATEITKPSDLAFRFAGFVICGVGATFLSSIILEALFPA